MSDPRVDNSQYFMSEQHQVRVAHAMQRETAKIAAQANVDNAFAISDAIGSLFALCSFLRAIGLKDIAITILKQALVFARKGVPAGRPGEDA